MFEDALAGVEAGAAGGFGSVVGVDRVGHGHADDLLAARRRQSSVGDLAARSLLGAATDQPTARAITHRSSRGRSARRASTCDVLAQSESVFALSNGHLGLARQPRRGRAPRPPRHLPERPATSCGPLPYAEAGYGYPESGQTVINVTNGKIIRLLVDDEPFDVRYGTLRVHERVLDLRAGVLRREVEWVSPAGQAVRVTHHPAGLASPSARWPRSATRSRPSTTRRSGGRAVRAGRQRVAARAGRATPGWPPRSSAPLGQEHHGGDRAEA